MDLRIAAENAGNDRLKVYVTVLNLADVEKVADILSKIHFDVLVNCTTMRSWFGLATLLPAIVWQDLYSRARFGPWLPLNLAPCLQLMKARRLSEARGAVVNVCFPDAVNPVLGKMGLAPTVGAGNSEIVASVLRIATAEILSVDVCEISVSLIAHHFHLANLDRDTSWSDRAFWYRMRQNGRDVTAQLDFEAFQASVRRNCPHKSSVPAAVSAIKNVRRILGADAGRVVHASSPAGMAGGYDVRFKEGKPQIALEADVSLQDASGILERAARGDGIEQIATDGTVHFGANEAAAMREVLGYDCPVLRPTEVEERGRELLARFDELAVRLKSRAA